MLVEKFFQIAFGDTVFTAESDGREFLTFNISVNSEDIELDKHGHLVRGEKTLI